MVISLVVAHLWGVLQLLVLASFARTVRMRTVYAALGAGLFLCAPVTVALQVALTKIFTSSTGMSVPDMVRIAGYTLDPFIEEIAKVLPLFLLLMVSLYRRQWSFTDLVLIGAATGSGFGMAEDLYRFGGAADHAQSIAGGWALVFSNDYLLVPNIFHILTSWLPHGAAAHDTARLNEHLIWSAVAGLAVGLVVLVRTTAARLWALGLFVCVSLDHAAGNMSDVGDSWLAYLAWPLRALVHLRPLMPLAALGAAWWLDQKRNGTGVAGEPLLEAERSASSRLSGILGAAFSRLPWSFIAVDRFVRMRRAARTEHLATQSAPLNALVVKERDRVDVELAKLRTKAPSLWPEGWSATALRAALRRPSVVFWLLIMSPSVLYFVIGGWPQTSGLQAFMLHPLVARMLFPISVLAQAWILWRTIIGLRARSRIAGAAIGDEAALIGLRAACGIGAVSLGAFSLLRMLGGAAPGSSILASLHAQSAANRLTPGGGSMLANSAGAFDPPPASPDLPDQGSSSSSSSSSGTSGSDSDSSPSPSKNNAPPPTPKVPDEPPAANDAASPLSVADAEERVTAAHRAADAADIAAADDFKDPWGEKSPARAAADDARDAARAAEAQRDEAVDAAQQKLDADAEAAAQAQSAQEAAAQQAIADQRAADPQGAALDDAVKAAADAQRRADEAFMDANDPDGSKYHEALEAAQQARQQAEAAAHPAIAQQGAADPVAAAAADLDKAAAEAQQRADKAFTTMEEPGGSNYHDAQEAAIQARQQADAARSALDAKAARQSSTGWKPDKP